MCSSSHRFVMLVPRGCPFLFCRASATCSPFCSLIVLTSATTPATSPHECHVLAFWSLIVLMSALHLPHFGLSSSTTHCRPLVLLHHHAILSPISNSFPSFSRRCVFPIAISVFVSTIVPHLVLISLSSNIPFIHFFTYSIIHYVFSYFPSLLEVDVFSSTIYSFIYSLFYFLLFR